MSENKWKLSLDIKDFVKDTNEAKEAVLKVGDSENLSGLINSLSKTSMLLGIVGAAALALKVTIDAVFDAEQIKAVNAQFDVMAKNAGLAGDAIKEKVVEAAKGLADDTKILQASTKAIAELGKQAGKIPEIMDLARKTTNAFGGELVDNFEKFATAAATGNTRMLRQMNLVINSDEALKKYAKTLGVSVDELSEAGRKHAILNEILEKGNKNLDGVDENSKRATDAWTRSKVAIGQLADAVSLLIERLGGNAIATGFEKLAAGTKQLADGMTSAFGVGREQAEAELRQIGREMKMLDAQLEQERKFHLNPGDLPNMEKRLEALKARKIEIDKALEAKKGSEPEAGPDAAPVDDVDKEKRAKAVEKFNKELLTLNKMRHEEEIKNAQFSSDLETEVERDKQFRMSQVLLEAKIKSDQISQEYANKDEERRQLLEQNDALTQARILQVEEETKNRRIAIMKEATDHSVTMAQGVTNAFKEGAAENRKNLTDWGATGRIVFGAFSKNAKSALLEFGAGTKDAGEAMRGFLFGAIADTAEAKGMELLLSSLWPPNPIGMGAGAGLVALAGALRSQSGGKGGGGVGGGGAGGGGAAAGTGSAPVESGRPTEASTAPRSGVMITVQGHWLETDQSKSWLTDQIRSASDNQDFSFKRIGEA